MLSYSVGESETLLFTISPSSELEVQKISISKNEPREDVERFRQMIPSSRLNNPIVMAQLSCLQALGEHLYETLLRPATDAIAKSDRLLILPDGPLHCLPWGALVQRVDGSVNPKGYRYLIEWKPLHFALSATVYSEMNRLREGKPPRSVSLADFADPVYPKYPKYSVHDSGQIKDVRVRSASQRGFDFQPIPATRREVESVADNFGEGARIYVGSADTEEVARQDVSDVHYLHCAIHGLLDPSFPLNSGLALSIPEEPGEGQHNGLLQAWEIIERVRLGADLVTLSACESGLGQEFGGDGLIGLTRAFQYAGARTVAASLWSVADEATAELMT